MSTRVTARRHWSRFRAGRATGPSVTGEALVSNDDFSVRYDVDGETGTITRQSHDLYGSNIADKVLIFRRSKGGVATAWALFALKRRGLAPQALVCDVANPVFVQGAVLAGIPIMDAFTRTPRTSVRTGDRVRVDTKARVLLHRVNAVGPARQEDRQAGTGDHTGAAPR
jgi:predicted aconitase with swiveling domain